MIFRLIFHSFLSFTQKKIFSFNLEHEIAPILGASAVAAAAAVAMYFILLMVFVGNRLLL